MKRPELKDEWTDEADEAFPAGPGRGGRAVRPRHAATLILRRGHGASTEVLMGRRHERHRFMPNKFAFPGGGVDASDARVLPSLRLKPHVEARLRKTEPPARARALGLAAIRETFEETGIVVGHPRTSPGAPTTRATVWRTFLDLGYEPALGALEYVARAITPPNLPRRFDARFFSVNVTDVPAAATPLGPASGELEGLRWVTLHDAHALDLPNITREVLNAVTHRLQAAPVATASVPFFRVRHGRLVIDRL